MFRHCVCSGSLVGSIRRRSQIGFDTRLHQFNSVSYTAERVCLDVNGLITFTFAITQIVLQGDPLSSYPRVVQALPLKSMFERY